ncbi:cytochrome b/b6 domain-containing protein [Devosia sp. Leaf64]|uniref:cytochrome b n=1 Tax=Devosia sp. Leaf64 TaxID=1736229 RepID=UPI000712525C|nr:cytochrome b/b6 domain-containing protein [Devosia sp. Leaf64]KQN74660.1 hypothetical protein ASE94_19870 [Devosia sp. Leaf64]
MPLKSNADRYGSVAIAIHWGTAVLIIALFVTGLQAASQTNEATKITLLRAHIPLVIGVLVLTALRIVWRLLADRGPNPPPDEPAWRRRLAQVVHVGLYVVVIIAAASGIAVVVISGALPSIIGGTSLPELAIGLPRAMHGIVPRLMLALLALHVGAALYHQFVLRDRLLARMGLGRHRNA